MEFENILFAEKDGIATVTFNRPKSLNALNDALLDEFGSVLEHVEDNEYIRVLVLTGAGDKAFVAGADINEIATFTPLKAKYFSKKGQAVIGRLETLPVPVIAAVNGYALGGGCEMALASDFIYAGHNAFFGLPEINLGIIPGFGGTQRLARLVGKNMAKEMIFTGKMISAEEALKIGLVNRLCPPETLMEEVMKTAGVMASKGKASLRAAKEAVNKGFEVDLATGCSIETDAFALCFGSPDAKEGTSAFLEKRKPLFSGSMNE